MPVGVPLLRAAEAAVSVTLDGRVLMATALLFGVVSVIVWRAPLAGVARAFAHRRARRRAVWTVATVLAFFAVLPAVLPYDHIIADVGTEDEAAHASHCHGAPGACADAPGAAGFGKILGFEPLVVVPSLIAVLLVFPVLALRGVTRRPDVPVPLRLIAL